jgi:hypothetical protein
MKAWKIFFTAGLAAVQLNLVAAESVRVTVDVDKPGHVIPATLHGLFFEDINYAGDGGLYAELIQNRSFEDDEPLYGWSEIPAHLCFQSRHTRIRRGKFRV